jgi:hypothetical protein
LPARLAVGLIRERAAAQEVYAPDYDPLAYKADGLVQGGLTLQEAVQILLLNNRGFALCVSQIIEMLGLAPSTVPKYLRILYTRLAWLNRASRAAG